MEPHQSPDNRMSAYAAGIPGGVRLVYLPAEMVWQVWRGQARLKQLEPDVSYRAFYFDPKTGEEIGLGTVQGDAQSEWTLPKPPIFQDWVLVVEPQ
jgi:hypothetical protein